MVESLVLGCTANSHGTATQTPAGPNPGLFLLNRQPILDPSGHEEAAGRFRNRNWAKSPRVVISWGSEVRSPASCSNPDPRGDTQPVRWGSHPRGSILPGLLDQGGS